MYSIQFWKHWQRPYQFLFWLLSGCLVIVLVLFWKGYFDYPAPAITLDHYQQLQSLEAPSHSFSVGLINLTVPAESYVILEHIFGSSLRPNVFASYFFLATLVIAFIFFVSIVTDLSRYRFLMAMGVAILFLASLQVDTIEVFGLTNRSITAALIVIYGLLAFYFHALKTEASFLQRLLSFSMLTALIGFIISFFTKTQLPLLNLSANGLMAGVIVTLLFILTVSHEIVASFITIITRSLKSEKSLQHFLILTAIYLINVFLIFASKMGIIEWSFFSVSPFFLISVSMVLGIWGFKQREPIHETILNHEPLRIYFFLSLALVSLGTMTFFVSSASDMMIDALEDFVVAAHFGGGLIFALYVIANFAPMLVKNLSVYKILYKPETMPLFTFRLMAVIATFAVLSWAVSWKTYLNQMVATYYHVQGDMYLAKHDDVSAETLYLKSLRFRNQNHHAHYALASIYAGRSESIKERKEYDKAIQWTPSVPLYLNLAQTYASHGDLLEAALTLDEGKKKFGNSGELQNAAGLSFLKLKNADSALFFFQKTQVVGATKNAGETNSLAAAALFNLDYPIDSIVVATQTNGVRINQLAIANLKQQKIAVDGKFSNDTSLSVYDAMMLCNYLVNQRATVDTALIRKAINLSHKEVNGAFAEQLLISSAHALYAHGLIREALQTLRETAFTVDKPGYFSLMGLWLLEQNNPFIAITYLKAAAEKSAAGALYHQAIAETEADSLKRAMISWDSLRKSSDKSIAAFADKMIKVLKSRPEQVSALADNEKYYFCRYRIPLTDKTQFEKIVSAIGDESLKAQAIIDRARKWFSIDEPSEAESQLNKLGTSYARNINQRAANLRLMLAAEKEDWQFVRENLIKTDVTSSQKIYFEALIAAQSGNQNVASQKFNYLIKADNQFEEGILAAVRFAVNDTTNQLKTFSNLVEGLLAKPNSVKLLKQHSLMAAALGFPDAAQDSLNKLRAILPDFSFKKFVNEHQDYFARN